VVERPDTQSATEHLVPQDGVEGGDRVVRGVDQEPDVPSRTASSWPPIRVATEGVPQARPR